MKEKITNWIQTTDWNAVFETFLTHSYIMYYLPFPILLFATYYFLKLINVPSFWLRSGLSVLATLSLYLYHRTGVTLPRGELDFTLIGVVANEVILASSVGLLAILIYFIRSIVSGVLNVTKRIRAKQYGL